MGNELVNRTIELENEVYRMKQRISLLEDLKRVFEQQVEDINDEVQSLKKKTVKVKKKQ
jgi:hypothetical protein